MKYDKELFELSDYFKTVYKHEKDSKDTEIKKRKLFRLILDKFRQSKPDDGVFKVDSTPFVVCKSAIVQHLKKNVENIGMCFFNFIK